VPGCIGLNLLGSCAYAEMMTYLAHAERCVTCNVVCQCSANAKACAITSSCCTRHVCRWPLAHTANCTCTCRPLPAHYSFAVTYPAKNSPPSTCHALQATAVPLWRSSCAQEMSPRHMHGACARIMHLQAHERARKTWPLPVAMHQKCWTRPVRTMAWHVWLTRCSSCTMRLLCWLSATT
jgi:hypothetical protein